MAVGPNSTGLRRGAWRAALGGLAGLSLAPVGCFTHEVYTPAALPAFGREDVRLDVPPVDDRGQKPVTAHKTDGVSVPVPPVTGPGDGRPAEVTLPEAVTEVVFYNLRVKAGAEKVQQARADLLSDSLIPNPQFLYDSILNPVPGVKFTPTKQGGPPQNDYAVNFPIDWWVFGKRVAAMQASRLGVDVAAADFADLVRQRVADTVSGFYDLLEAKALLDLARQDQTDLKRVEEITRKRVGVGGVGTIEIDRARLAVLDSQREVRTRETAVAAARSKLRPLLGRSTVDPAFDARGSLDVAEPPAPPDLTQALELAGQQRPDVISLVRQVAKAEADVERERRKAFPQVSVQPYYTFQYQASTIGFPNARSYGVAITSSLPFTDRNQGNIAKARSGVREAHVNLLAQLTEVRAEVEQAVQAYRTALAAVSADDPATLEAARSVRDRTEAAYGAGGRTLLEVLDAQRAYRDRVRSSISNKAEYWRALHRLNAAVGSRALDPSPPKAP